jgi:hypothetical protein
VLSRIATTSFRFGQPALRSAVIQAVAVVPVDVLMSFGDCLYYATLNVDPAVQAAHFRKQR